MSVLEVKTDHESWKWGTPGTDEVPIFYRTQVMWYLDVFGLDVAYIAVLLGGLRFAEYRVEYNVAEAVELREMAREFLDSIEAGVSPDIDASSQTYEVLKELHPEVNGTEVEIDLKDAIDWVEARVDLAESEAWEQTMRNTLAQAMGNAKYAVCNGKTIARRQVKKGGTPYVVAARDLPTREQLTEAAA